MDKSSSKDKRKIVCFHLFNDFSGSPTVLKGILEGLLNKDESIDLITSKGGVLDSLESPLLRRISYSYKFSDNKAVTTLRFIYAQIFMMLVSLRYAFRKNTKFYINTILPVGAAMIGKLTAKKVIYHYHENAYEKSVLYSILAQAMEKLADEIVCVSEYQAALLKRKHGIKIIPNSLRPEFLSNLKPDTDAAFDRKNVLMISSLKEYKGIKEFIEIAGVLKNLNFTLVLNSEDEEIRRWTEENGIQISENLSIYPRSNEVANFYNKASLVLNLSNPDLVVETFGMTVLEALSAGLPVIVPPVGGIAEMVEDGFNGYKIHVKEISKITTAIENILSDKNLYTSLSRNALAFSKRFSNEEAVKAMANVLT